MEQVTAILSFIGQSFIHIWPYLIITIPIAVSVNLTDFSKTIRTALSRKPILSILLATAIGAFSPFCSCGVIPIITSLLIGGVPLAPVMAFWIASPSMDPEIFFLSTATIGWKLSVWRLLATFSISLLSGYITHMLHLKGWFGESILKKDTTKNSSLFWSNWLQKLKLAIYSIISTDKKESELVTLAVTTQGKVVNHHPQQCCGSAKPILVELPIKESTACESEGCTSNPKKKTSFYSKLLKETLKATVMVSKFMLLAFFVNALIHFYVPQNTISAYLGGEGIGAVILATLVGIPFYTSNLTAIPLISGLLDLGINQGVALAFLISGPVTTLPAMAAVWGIVRKKVFFLYIAYALLGALLFGLLFNLVEAANLF